MTNMNNYVLERKVLAMFDIVGLGELLIDFTPAGNSESGMAIFERNPGGAPANMLTAANKAGLSTAFVGKVGNDMHGLFLKKTLEDADINTSNLIVADDVFTTLAFVTLNENGERDFSFARKPGADTQIRFEEIDKACFDTKVFHVGSLSLTDDPAKTATFEAVKAAKANGAIISYDPNYRAPLWSDVETAKVNMQSLLPYADMIKISDEETDLLTPYKEPEKAAAYLLENGLKIVAVTLGADGALIACAKGSAVVPGFKSKVVDTTGAGDSFWGGFVSMVLGTGKAIEDIEVEELKSAVTYGNALASLVVEKRGGITSIPEVDAIKKRIAEA